MAVVNQAGPQMMTTTGQKAYKRRCGKCGEFREDDLFTVNANGQSVGSCCASARYSPVRADCEDGVCTCENKEPEDGKLDDSTVAE